MNGAIKRDHARRRMRRLLTQLPVTHSQWPGNAHVAFVGPAAVPGTQRLSLVHHPHVPLGAFVHDSQSEYKLHVLPGGDGGGGGTNGAGVAAVHRSRCPRLK